MVLFGCTSRAQGPVFSWQGSSVKSEICEVKFLHFCRMTLLGGWGLALTTLASLTNAFSIEGITSELGFSEALMEGEPR